MTSHKRTYSSFKSPSKYCRGCQRDFPRTLKYFHKDTARGDGLQYLCKTCQNAANLASHAKNRPAYLARMRAYAIKNKDQLNAKQREKDAANPEAARARRQANYQKHHAKRLVGFKIYRQTHVEQIREAVGRRRALKASAPANDFSAAQWREMQEAYDHLCSYCGKRTKGHLTQDHITPLSGGGAHTFSNIVPACRSCNSKKQAGPPLSPVQPLLLTVASSKKEKAA